jgi:hypothetical protein
MRFALEALLALLRRFGGLKVDDVTSKPDKPRQRMRELFARTLEDQDALAALAAARDLRTLLYEWEGVLARKSVARGASWEEVGSLLGVSRQAGWTRYKDPSLETPAIREARDRLAKARNRSSE